MVVRDQFDTPERLPTPEGNSNMRKYDIESGRMDEKLKNSIVI